MKIIIKNKVDTPIYEQIYEQVKDAILDGKVAEGEQMPSIRQLAKDLKISVITTTKAYSVLEENGFITPVKGKGYYVAPKNNDILIERFIMSVENCFAKAVRDGKNADLSDDELIDMLKAELREYDNE